MAAGAQGKFYFIFGASKKAKNPSKKYYSDLNGCHSRGVLALKADNYLSIYDELSS
jgi:hypothetical protein